MTDREKLIHLTQQFVIPYFAYKIADYLLANGVTFATDTNVPSKWTPVTERMPPENTRVLLFVPNVAEGGNVRIGVLEPIKLWFTDGRDRLLYAQVTHWMPLPEAPKEDKP